MKLRINHFLLLLVCGTTSCTTLSDAIIQDRANSAEHAEFHGKSEYWAYANAGLRASAKADHITACKMFLRAYRNTGVPLLGPRPPAKDPRRIRRALFGAIGEITYNDDARATAEELDALTPAPGVGPATNQVLSATVSYLRSMAAYNWARAAGQLGNFSGAEAAFHYSLRLDRLSGDENLISMRHYELGRLYTAWGKPDLALLSFRNAIATTPERISTDDPIGFSFVLDEYSSVLDTNGESAEAARIRQQSDDLRRANPRRKPIFRPTAYPTKSTSVTPDRSENKHD